MLRRCLGPTLNANVVAARAETRQGNAVHSREVFVTSVSDFLLQEDGSFEIPGLPPGDYYVYIEPVDNRFTGGSAATTPGTTS